MDEIQAIQNNLEKAIEKDDIKVATDIPDGGRHTSIQPYRTVRERLRDVIESQKFHISVVTLVVIDSLLVIAELLIDLDVLKIEDKEHHVAPQVLHGLSIAVLSIFMVEIAIRIFVMRLEFFKHKLEVFDAIVVIVSFILDIVFQGSEGTVTGVGLLVVLRLWRVTRILNGIIMSVKAQAQRQIDQEVEKRVAYEKENAKLRLENSDQTREIERLTELLLQHGITFSYKINTML